MHSVEQGKKYHEMLKDWRRHSEDREARAAIFRAAVHTCRSHQANLRPIADLFEVSISTFTAWAYGVAVPHRLVQERVLEVLAGAFYVTQLYSVLCFPLEAGMNHEGEEILKSALARGPYFFEHVTGLVEGGEIYDGYQGDFFRLLGRLGPIGTAGWRENLVQKGLQGPVFVREAAIEAAEGFGIDEDMREVLRGHQEHVGWIREYLEAVLYE